MPATQRRDVEHIVEDVKRQLAAAEKEDVHLAVTGYSTDDEWLYIVVVPSRPGVRASVYANCMSKVERTLRAAGHEHVFLVPRLED